MKLKELIKSKKGALYLSILANSHSLSIFCFVFIQFETCCQTIRTKQNNCKNCKLLFLLIFIFICAIIVLMSLLTNISMVFMNYCQFTIPVLVLDVRVEV